MRTALVIVALIAPVEEIIELTEKIFKSRIISQEAPVGLKVRSIPVKFSPLRL